MIDFRYLIITIVAIFLALAVGIVTGAGFLGEPLREGLEAAVQDVRDANDSLQEQINELRAELDNSDSFNRAVEPWITDGQLSGRRFVVFAFDGTNGAVLDSVRDGLVGAGGELSATITISDKFALQNQPERDLLADLIGSVSSDSGQLRQETAAALGRNALAMSNGGVTDPPQRQNALLNGLVEQGFASVDDEGGGNVVPNDATFLVVGGATDHPPFPVASFAERLGVELGEGGDVLAAESSVSVWGLVQAIRDSGEASSLVSTVDQIETVEGRVAMVLGLDQAGSEPPGHWGTLPGASEQIPPPADGQ